MNSNSLRCSPGVLFLAVSCLAVLAGCDSTYNHVVSIAVTPASPSIAVGKTQQFTATATNSKGPTSDVTNQVIWASDTTSVATISGGGLATGVSTGSAKITAALNGIVSPPDALTVTAAPSATLVSIAVTPNPPPASVPVGSTLQLTATGTYSDSTTKDLTSQVTWKSATISVATISTTGLVTGVTPGTSKVTATLGAVVSPVDVVTVVAALTSITLNPATATIPVGGTADFTATGHYSDGSSQILAAATWSSGTPATASITSTTFTNTATPPVTTSVGAALGLAANATAVTIKATSGAVFGTASLTVSAPVARNLYVTGTLDSKNAVYVVNPSSAILLPIQSGVDSGVPSQFIPEPSGRFVFSLRALSIGTSSVDPVSGRLIPPSSLLSTTVNSNSGVVDPTGQYLYVVSLGVSSTLNTYRINLLDGTLTPTGSPKSFTRLISVIIDRTGKFLYAVDNDPSVQKVFAFSIGAGGALTALATPSYPTGAVAQYPAIDPSNTHLYIPNQMDGSISAFTINADGSLTAVPGSPFTAGIGIGPSYVAVDTTGKFLYVTNNVDSTISALSIGAGGALGTAAAGSPYTTSAPGATPLGIAIDPSDSTLAVSNLFGNTVSLFTLNSTTGVLTPAVLPQIESPAGADFVTFGIGTASPSVSPGAVFAANSVSGDISAFTSSSSSGALTAAASSPVAGLTANSFAATDLQGNFFFTGNNAASSQLAGFSVAQSTAGLTALGGSPLTVNSTDHASATYVAPTDNFAYALDLAKGSVFQYALTSTTVGSPGTSSSAFAGASNIAADPQGEFIYALGLNATNGIQPFLTYTSGGALALATQSPTLPGNWTSGAVDGSGQYLVAVDSTAKTLQSFSIGVPGSGTDGVLTANGGTVAVTGTGPFAIAFDPLDRVIFVADQAAGTVTVYPFNATTGAIGAAGTVTNVSLATGLTRISADLTGTYFYAGIKAAAVPGSKGAIAVYKIGAGGSLTSVLGSPFITGTGNPGIAVTNVVQ